MTADRLRVTPCTIAEAKVFVDQHHRHHKAPQGGLFAVAASRGDDVVGVAIVGRPVARLSQDGLTAEVTRLCVLDDQRNACSILYAACWRAARALGYLRIITYTLATESGSSLRGAGWVVIGQVRAGAVSHCSWNREGRPRVDKHPLQEKLKWEARS